MLLVSFVAILLAMASVLHVTSKHQQHTANAGARTLHRICLVGRIGNALSMVVVNPLGSASRDVESRIGLGE